MQQDRGPGNASASSFDRPDDEALLILPTPERCRRKSYIDQSAVKTQHKGAGYAVSGQVQRSSNQIRINVHLRDLTSGRELWSERFQRPFDDLFLIQQQISAEIASQLSIRITGAEKHRLSQPYAKNLQAYEYFLRAQSLLLLRLKADNKQARQHYRSAIDLDPSFARAYAGLALSHAADYRNQWVNNGQLSLKQARNMADSPLQIDSETPEIYWVLAYLNAQNKQHEKAIELLQRAISLDQSPRRFSVAQLLNFNGDRHRDFLNHS